MMSYLFYLFFMIPMFYFNFWYMYQFIYLVFILLFILVNVNFGFCCVGYLFGVDCISYVLIILSFYIISLMNLASCYLLKYNYLFFTFINYLICLFLFFIFSSMNMFIMYISFEFILIPLMILILGWGYQPERLISGLYLFFYTLFGSLPLFLFIIFIYLDFYSISFVFNLCFEFNFMFHLMMVIPFMISLPMFMLHFWLPKAHVQAPISGSMILAGLMLKIGGYGLIRFIYLNEYFCYYFNYIWFSFSMLGLIMVGFVCIVQVDLKCLIAYSSISHMMLCLMGILSMSKLGLLGSLILLVSHGLCSSGLFCLANICYLRLFSRSLYLVKGMIFFMPTLSLFWFLFSVFNMGCPPSINFVSEFMIIISSLYYFEFSYFYLLVGSFLCACFSFYLYSFSQHGNFNYMYSHSNVFVSEILLLICHLLPLIILLFLFMIF
uniref:NADH-ubiquinone oxidoreductase chain 4 n=1 Tax=Leptobelus boreosinensis TaxID=3065209 RepID=A0AA95NNB6_9HEMI|nr:NADH dehydrogenase subunit 4 [Leptobelus boreosinensis]WKZ08053.1 NADH dehydrogenase subunit 4 [Leptobelus boreosinensis]